MIHKWFAYGLPPQLDGKLGQGSCLNFTVEYSGRSKVYGT